MADPTLIPCDLSSQQYAVLENAQRCMDNAARLHALARDRLADICTLLAGEHYQLRQTEDGRLLLSAIDTPPRVDT